MQAEGQPQIYNEALPDSQEPGYSAIYRQKGLKELVKSMDPDMHTIRDLIERTVHKYGDKNGFGTVTFYPGQIIVQSDPNPNSPVGPPL